MCAIMDIVSFVCPKCITITQKQKMHERDIEINKNGIENPTEECHRMNKIQANEYISDNNMDNA